jgi:pimeloyl-ACP methyl ester carboxylesterase
VELNHHRTGSGDPVVLIHGIGMQWQSWRPVIERLTPHREVIAIDLPGFGGSRTLPAGVIPTPPNFARAVIDFMGRLGLTRPVVAGLSLGGWTALEIAKTDAARAAVAISPAGFWSRMENAVSTTQLRMTRLTAVRGGALVQRGLGIMPTRVVLLSGMIGRPLRVPVEDARAMNRAVAAATGFDATLAAMHGERFSGGEKIEIPVTIAWGTRDRLLVPRQAKRAVAEIPGAKLVPIKGGGHIPFHDDPELVAQTILAA